MFVHKLEDQTVRLNEYREYVIDIIHNTGLTITTTFIANPNTVGGFFSLSGTNIFKIYSTYKSEIGTYDIMVILTDTKPKTNIQSFKLNIINSPPYFVGKGPKN